MALPPGLTLAIIYTEIRKAVCKLHCECPECETDQIQLVYSGVDQSNFKCRKCKSKFSITYDTAIKLDKVKRVL